jgi:hypothetical protein
VGWFRRRLAGWEKRPPNPDRRNDHSFFRGALAVIRSLSLAKARHSRMRWPGSERIDAMTVKRTDFAGYLVWGGWRK